MSNDLLSAALACIEAGLSIIPIDHTTKRPAMDLLPKDANGTATWRPYQAAAADEQMVRQWFASGIRAFALVTGAVSGNLLVLDFDALGFYEAWREAVGELADGLPVQRTGGGGYHVYLRCPEPGGNLKLAWVECEEEKSGRKIAIETRGEGGYAVAPPSLHPSGDRYEIVSGDLTNVSMVSQARADALVNAACKLDESPHTREKREQLEREAREAFRRRAAAARNGSGDIIGRYNAAHAIEDLLGRYGYTRRGRRFIRPNGRSGSVSVEDGRSCHFSSNDPLNDGRVVSGCGVHDAFDIYCFYEHGGNVSGAVKAAAALLGIRAGSHAKGMANRVAAARAPVKPYTAFPVDALPKVAARFINEGARALGCDPAYIAMPLLAELASAIGNSRRIRLKASWDEPPVAWAVVVGDSGTLKSPAFDLALRPIRLRQKRAMKEYKQAQAEYADAKEEYDEAVKAWRKAKPADRGDKPEEPEAPVCERLWCSDTTLEALADRLSNAPRGLLVAREELAGWLASFNQYKAGQGADVPHWLEMHRAGHLLVDRKTGIKTTIDVPRAAVCIAGGIQPEILRRCLTQEFYDNGLAARLLLAMPPRRVKRWTEADIDGNTLDAVSKLFSELLSFQPSTDLDGEPEPADVSLTDEAKALWVDFYNQHAQEQAELDSELSAAWSKLEGYAARLALVVHCIRQAAGEAVDPWHCDDVSMASGIALAGWFGYEAKRVYGVLAESQEDQHDRKLVDWIQRHGGQVTPRDLTHGLRSYRDNATQAEEDLERLAAAGIGRWQTMKQNSKGGRQLRVFHLLAPVTETAGSGAAISVTVTKTSAGASASAGNGDGDSDGAHSIVGRDGTAMSPEAGEA